MLKIKPLTLSQVDLFLDFNRKAYPHRKNIKEHFNWWFMDNPLLKDKDTLSVYLCVDDTERIIGQALFNLSKFYFQGETKQVYFGSDYYVLPENRGMAGILLSMKVLKKELPFIGIGPTNAMGNMLLSSGLTSLGSTRTFVWFRNPLVLLTLAKNVLFHGRKGVSISSLDNTDDNSNNTNNPNTQNNQNNLNNTDHPTNKNNLLDNANHQLPEQLFSNEIVFNLVSNLNDFVDYSWDNIIGFSRDSDFLKWRFFNDYRKYFCYASTTNSMADKKMIYFVIRIGTWNGMKLLFLVDYKLPPGSIFEWKAILKLTKKIAKLNKCDAVVTVCSHHFFEKEVKKNFFIKMGKENLVITNLSLGLSDEIIKKRESIYATMADSDQEFSFWW